MFSTAEAARLILRYMQDKHMISVEKPELILWMRTNHGSQCNDAICEDAITMLAAEGAVDIMGETVVYES